MLLGHFSSKNGKNNFSIFSRFQGIPARENFFSQNYFFRRAILSPSLNIFWRDRWKMKDNNLAHTKKRKVDISSQGPWIPRNVRVYSMFQHFGEFPAPGVICQLFLIAMFQIASSFICHRSRQKMLRDDNKKVRRKYFFVKKIFFAIGDSPKSWENVFFIFWKRV